MVLKSALPPTYNHPHLTNRLSPDAALEHVSKFLKRTQSTPHLHPDSLLSSSGITYSAHSGPSGGLTLHHLKRVQAGLRGENLIAETAAELLLWDQGQDGDALPEGDDSRLDALIEKDQQQLNGRKSSGLKRKRSMMDIEEWAETSSQAGAPPDSPSMRPYQELESFANTPLHVSDWQEQEEYELEQSPLEGEVGDRDGAPMVQQNGIVPELAGRDDQGNFTTKKRVRDTEKKGKDGALTDADRRARTAEKKARRMAARLEKANQARQGKG